MNPLLFYSKKIALFNFHRQTPYSGIFNFFEKPRVKPVGTVESRIKEPIFIRTLRLKFNILSPLDKSPSEADTAGGSYVTGFMSSEQNH